MTSAATALHVKTQHQLSSSTTTTSVQLTNRLPTLSSLHQHHHRHPNPLEQQQQQQRQQHKQHNRSRTNSADSPTQQMECTICLEPISAASTTGHVRCGHWFHFDCLHLWSQRSSSCPMCRQQFDEVAERAIHESQSSPTASSIPIFGPVIKRIPCVRRPVPLSPVPPEEAMRLYEFVFQQDDAEMEDVECEICGQSPCVCGNQDQDSSDPSFTHPTATSATNRRRGPNRSPGRNRASNLLGRLGRRQTSNSGTSQTHLVFDRIIVTITRLYITSGKCLPCFLSLS